jgi:hypothetical protein
MGPGTFPTRVLGDYQVGQRSSGGCRSLQGDEDLMVERLRARVPRETPNDGSIGKVVTLVNVCGCTRFPRSA